MNSLRNRLILLFVVVTTTTLSLFGLYEQMLLREDLERRFGTTRQEIIDHLRYSLAGPGLVAEPGNDECPPRSRLAASRSAPAAGAGPRRRRKLCRNHPPAKALAKPCPRPPG